MSPWSVADFQPVEVRRLPLFHAPFKCAHAVRFERFLRGAQQLSMTSDEAELVAGAQFYTSLSSGDFEVCDFHDGNWSQIAEASIELLANLSTFDPDAIGTRADAAFPGKGTDAAWLASLFWDPIVWRDGQSTVTNGQHRLCAIRASGAQRVIVFVSKL